MSAQGNPSPGRRPRWFQKKQTPDRESKDQAGLPKWSLGILNDHETMEVPGKKELHACADPLTEAILTSG